MPTVLEIKDLKIHFNTQFGLVRAVDGVDFSVEAGQTLGVVGESGCGKSVTALGVMGLIRLPGKIVGGEILYRRNGQTVDLARLEPRGKEIRSIRGNQIAMIFQEPMTSLNPVFTIGFQIMESIRLHQHLSRRNARDLAIRMLAKVGIPLPERRVDEYPHQLSGGMRQRAMIAMALCCRPAVLIADEPTTALDVTIQAQVLELMKDLQSDFHTSIVMITHALGVIAGMADHVAVMYLGKVVEKAQVNDIFHDPRHPYTRGLLESMPSIIGQTNLLHPIRGVVPDPFDLPAGCSFEPRCPQAREDCRQVSPALREIVPRHWVACREP